MTTHYTPAPAQPITAPAAPITQTPTVHIEGMEFHPPGFHGELKQEPVRESGSMEKKPLEKVDLGAERAKQNVHTAANANWKAPQEEEKMMEKQAQRKPMFTPKQLRDAFIMQEILDEPVSRRKGIRRGYGS